MGNHFWDNMNKLVWTNLPTPWKPGNVDIIIYLWLLVYLKIKNFGNKKKCVLLIGATTEIRKILSLLNIKYDLVDFSKHMEKLTRPQKDSLRFFIHVRWEEFNSTEQYDLILGDLIFNLIKKEKIAEVLQRLRLCLKNGGKIIVRHRFLGTLKRGAVIKGDSLYDKKMLYPLFANLQSLKILDKKSYHDSLFQINKSERFLSGVFKKDFLNNTFEYTLFTKKEALNIFPKFFMIRRSSPKKYIDTFCLIGIKKETS